jgi:hypothetical protein
MVEACRDTKSQQGQTQISNVCGGAESLSARGALS